MPANDAATILLSGLDWDVKREGLNTGGGAITPGMLVKRLTDGYKAHDVASGANEKTFARRDLSQAGGIDTTIAVGSQVRVGYARSGDQINAILNAGSGIAKDDRLVSDGAGGLITAPVAAQASLVIGAANAAVTFLANTLGAEGNDIQIEYLAATAAAATVTVTGNLIQIKPDNTTPGTTDQADDIISLVNADPAASSLVTASEGAGDGTSAVVTPVAATNLAGGLSPSDNEVAIALETVADPTVGFARVKVETL